MSKLTTETFKHNETGEQVEAVYFFEDKTDVPAIAEWCGGNVRVGGRFDGELITLQTERDIYAATEGMWIFKDSSGRFYPSEHDTFTSLYSRESNNG